MIVHVITGLNRGGAESALFRLLSQERVPSCVRVVSLSDGGVFKSRIEALGIEVVCLGMRSGVPSPVRWWRLLGLIRRWRPRLVQTWMYHADLLGGLAAFVCGVPVCWGIRHSDLSRANNKAGTLFVARLCALLSSRIPARAISCSEAATRTHRAFGYSVRFAVVPNGLDLQQWQPQAALRSAIRDGLALPERSFVFAHAGRNDPQKDHATLARAFSLVHARYPNARLLLCGDGLATVHPYFVGLPFTDSARSAVVALGPRDDLAELWQAADAFVLSSLGESFPNAVVEAMACGLPVVVTDVGDAAEIVGDVGFVVPPCSPDALASVMIAMTEMHGDALSRIGRASRERVVGRYSLEQMSDGFRQVWDEVSVEEGTRCVD